jgi:putative PEP-CTERM system TPR-repeat lipoprotein
MWLQSTNGGNDMSRRISKLAASATVLVTCQLLATGLTGCNNQSGEALLTEAKQYQQKGDDKAALIQLKNAASKSPENAEIRFQLASLHNKLTDGASAEKEIRKALAISKDRARAAPDLALALLLQGQPQKAIDETAGEAAKGGGALHTTRGDAFFLLNNFAQARESYKQALAVAPDYSQAFLGLARIALREKDVASALSLTEQAIKANPKDPRNWVYKGLVLRTQEKAEDAIAAFTQAIALQPTAPGPYLERASDEIGLKKFDAAKTDIAAASKIAPNTVQVTYTQGLYDAAQGNYAAARDAVQKVLAVEADHLPSILLAGMVELNLGGTEAAEQYLRKYIDNYPDNVFARMLLTRAMLKNGRPGEAILTLSPLLRSGKPDVQQLTLAGDAMLQGRDFSTAAEFFSRAIMLSPNDAGLHTSLALARLALGDGAKAITELETAVKLDPKSTRAAIELVRAELQLKHYDKAMAAVQKLEQAHPGDAEVLNLKGGAYLSKRDVANARSSFEKAIAARSDYFVPVTNLAGLDQKERKFDAAKKLYQDFLAKNKNHVGAMWGMAEIEGEQGNTAKATEWLERASTENPQLPAPAIKLGYHYLAIKENQKALTLLRKFSASHPSSAEMLDALGMAQLANHDNAGAIDSFGKLATLVPKSATVHLRLAAAHMAAENYDAATEDLKRAERAQPNASPARLGMMDIAMRQGKWADALAIIRDMQKKAPTSPLGYVLEGDLFMKQRQPANALPAYEKAYALVKSPEALIKIADALQAAGKQKEAEARLAQWRQVYPADTKVLLYQAQYYSSEKQYKPAAEALRVVLKLRPDDHIALNNLAVVYQQDKDPRALETAERAAKIEPNSPIIMDTLGWLLVEQGDVKRGLSLLQKAAGIVPDAKDIRFHMAIAMQKTGDKAGARKELEKLFADRRPFPQADEAKALLKVL